MNDASYFRDRAEMCLRIANSISDLASAEKLRLDAAAYLAQAEELDAQSPPSQPQSLRSKKPQDWI